MAFKKYLKVEHNSSQVRPVKSGILYLLPKNLGPLLNKNNN